MGQLHELLAVEGDLRKNKEGARQSAKDFFLNRPHLFKGSTRTLYMFDENRSNEQKTDSTELTTTVNAVLSNTLTDIIKAWDVKYQKELSNQIAKADIIVNGVTIVKDVPIKFLLDLETEIKELIKVFVTIPTLAPGILWEKDESKGTDIYRAAVTESFKTEKKFAHKVLVAAEGTRQAQLREWTEDKPVGKYITEDLAGMFSPADKKILINKAESMLHAVKQARQRANEQLIVKQSIGKDLLDYILS